MTGLFKIKQSLSKSNYLLGILLLALLARLIAVIISGDRELDYEWYKLVNNMSNGSGYTLYNWWPLEEETVDLIKDNPFPSAFMPPLYAFLLYSFRKIFPEIVNLMFMVGVFQAFLGAASCYLTYKIARLQFNENISILSAGIVAFFPLFVYASGQCSSVVLYGFLNLLVVYFLLKTTYVDTNIRRNMVFAGLFSGLLILARTEFLLYLPFIVSWIYFKAKKDLIKPLIYILVTVSVIFPWYLRNYMVFDQVLLTPQTAGGYNLWRGNHPGATSDGEFGNVFDDIRKEIKNIPLTNKFEIQVDKIMKDRAIHFIQHNIGQSLNLAGDKLFSFWVYDFDSKYQGVNKLAYWFPWLILLIFFTRGTIVTRKAWKENSLFYIYFILHSILIMAFFVVPRYRLFILPFMSILAAAGFLAPVRFRIKMSRKVYE